MPIYTYANIFQSEECMIYSIVTVFLCTIQVVLLVRLPVRFLVTCLFIDCMYIWNFLHPWSNFCLGLHLLCSMLTPSMPQGEVWLFQCFMALSLYDQFIFHSYVNALPLIAIYSNTVLPLRRYDKSHIMYQILHGGHVLVILLGNMMFHAVLHIYIRLE